MCNERRSQCDDRYHLQSVIQSLQASRNSAHLQFLSLGALNFSSLGIAQLHEERNIISTFGGFEASQAIEQRAIALVMWLLMPGANPPCNELRTFPSRPFLPAPFPSRALRQFPLHVFSSTTYSLNSQERTRNTLQILQIVPHYSSSLKLVVTSLRV